MKTHRYIYIDKNISLKEVCDKWLNSTILAIDTEFIRTNTFYPIPALIQIYDGIHCYLIDPLVISDFNPLKNVMLSSDTIKVLHSCSEDLEVFDRLFKTLPSPLFDTQIAAAFLGYGFSAGYARLLKTLYNIDIPKDETRSDWLQRPLSESQLNYAAMDVIYLYKLYEKISSELKDTEKKVWVDDCNLELSQQFYKNQETEQYFTRFKNSWRLDSQQQEVLFYLSLWREKTARAKNKPRSHIVTDDALYELALKQPASQDALKSLVELSSNNRKNYGHDLVMLLMDLKNLPVDKISSHRQLPDEPLPREAGDILKQLKQLVDDTAERLNIAPEMLARKKDLQGLVNSALKGKHCLPDSLKNWRQPVIGNLLLEATLQWHQQRVA